MIITGVQGTDWNSEQQEARTKQEKDDIKEKRNANARRIKSSLRAISPYPIPIRSEARLPEATARTTLEWCGEQKWGLPGIAMTPHQTPRSQIPASQDADILPM